MWKQAWQSKVLCMCRLKAANVNVHICMINPRWRPRVNVVIWCEMILAKIAQYVIHMSKLQCHFASLDKFCNLNVWIVLVSLYSKLRVIFTLRPVHLHGKKFVFSVTAWYVVHMLKLQCHYASIDKSYNLNMCGIALLKS